MNPESVLSPTPRVVVTCLTWNQCDDTLRCLESLARLDYPNLHHILVDNGSTDGTAEAVGRRFPSIHILRNAVNLGFGGGFNVGLRHALEIGAEYIFIINNDTTVASDAVSQLVYYAGPKEIGILTPKIYYATDPTRIWSVGTKRSKWTLEMTGGGEGEIDRGQWDTPREQDYLVGCALLLKRTLLERVGLFDERFSPIYYEDLDLCLRAQKAGFRLLLVPSAHVWHRGAASVGGFGTPRQRYLMARNSVVFFRKHAHGWRWLIVAPYRCASALKTSLSLLWTGDHPALASYWRGLRDGLRSRNPA